MMAALHRWLLPVLWLGWTAFWARGTADNKPVVRQESGASWLAYNLPLVVGAALLATPRRGRGWLSSRFPPIGRPAFWVGAVGVVVGLGFTVAARATLAGNWSATVTVKRDHELIRIGPYRLVRHPIYTGLLLALLGTAVARGDERGWAALPFLAASFLRKIGVEERFMAEQFPKEYACYRARTPALIPRLV